MSAPKKGKDLSALKARLAKKADEGAAPEATEAPAAEFPPPGEARAADLPAPGEARPVVADLPAPGEVRKPIDVPPPGERRPDPAPAPAAAARREALSEDLFSGGQAFDPNAGVIDDVGEIKAKGGLGLPIFAGLIGLVVGAGLGFMGHKVSEGNKRVDAAKAKAEKIATTIATIEEARAKVALRVGDAEEALNAKDGAKMSEALSGLEGEPVEISELFGWELATMDPEAVKAFFKLANGYNAMLFQAQFLKALAEAKKDVLTGQVSGPASYVVIRAPEGNGVAMAEAVSAICQEIPQPAEGEPPVDPNTLKKCEGDVSAATAWLVRTEIGGETAMAPAEAVSVLLPNGMYTFAIGTNPDSVVKEDVLFRIGVLKKTADDLKKNTEKAQEGAAALSDDPKVDG